MGKACSTHGAMRNAYKVLVGKPGRKRPQRRRNTKLDLREIGWSGVD
jgi:hypothetical protein